MILFLSYFSQAIAFYQSSVVDFDMDSALESLIFLSAHLAINTQLYCAIWNRSNLKELSMRLFEEINTRKLVAYFLKKVTGSQRISAKL